MDLVSISPVKSVKVQPEKPAAVWFESTLDGKIAVSIPHALIIGNATVREHCPTQEMS